SPVYLLSLVCSLLPRPPRSPLFPYTTLFRSRGGAALRAPMLRCGCVAAGGADERAPLVAVPGALRLLRAAIYGITPRCPRATARSEEHTSELQSRENLVCRLLLEKKKIHMTT